MLMRSDAPVAIGSGPLVRGHASRVRLRHARAYSLLRLLGVVLLIASLMKCWAVSRYPQPVSGSILESRAVVGCEIGVEGIVGVLLVSGLWPRGMWWVALVLFSGFTIVAGMEAIAGKDSCGCFGRAGVRPIYTMTFDVLAVVGLLLGRQKDEGRRMKDDGEVGREIRNPQSSIRNVRVWIACAIGLAWLSMVASFWGTRPVMAVDTAGAAGQTFGKSGELVVLEPEIWIGEKFSLADHIDVGSQLAAGRWIVLLVHHDCDHCAAAVHREIGHRGSELAGGKEQLAVVEMPPFAEAGEAALWQLPSGVMAGRLDQSRDWFATTPVALLVVDGKVIDAREGKAAEMPAGDW